VVKFRPFSQGEVENGSRKYLAPPCARCCDARRPAHKRPAAAQTSTRTNVEYVPPPLFQAWSLHFGRPGDQTESTLDAGHAEMFTFTISPYPT